MRCAAVALVALMVASAPAGPAERDYRADVEFLLDSIERDARTLLDDKGVDWNKARRRFQKEARRVRDDVEHLELVQRILAAARDGHAAVTAIHFEIPEDRRPEARKGVGLSLCVSGRKVLVKDCFGPARAAGVKSGFEVLEIDDRSARKWLQARADLLSETRGFSTDHAAFYSACHDGLADVPGTRFSFKMRGDRGSKSVTLTCASGGGNGVPAGPVFAPDGSKNVGRQSYAHLDSEIGWIHLRDVPGDLPAQLDRMLGDLGALQGLVLDLRANGGGGVDHDAVFSRFLAPGETFGGRRGMDEGAHYTGPMVVIVDAGTRSAGETVAGMFLATGRAYGIGPEPTAGMSGAKEVKTLPSGLMEVRYTVRSYHAGGPGGTAIEGHGVPPHEIVEYDAALLLESRDPMLEAAVRLLGEGLSPNAVRYPR